MSANNTTAHQLHLLMQFEGLRPTIGNARTKIFEICELRNEGRERIIRMLHHTHESRDVRMLYPIAIPNPTLSFEMLRGKRQNKFDFAYNQIEYKPSKFSGWCLVFSTIDRSCGPEQYADIS